MLIASTILYPRNLKCDEAGFNWLASVAQKMQPLWKTEIKFDARHLEFFDGNLCAPFGALLHDAIKNENSIDLGNVSAGVRKVWCKNEFSAKFGGAIMNDKYDTTLAFRRFPLEKDSHEFARYVAEELMSKELPDMSNEMRRDFARNIQEIFSNAKTHSESDHGIFSCGQFFPLRERLAFTLTDLGIGFRHNIERRFGSSGTDENAIAWATETGHSTRADNGGYGLADLRRFFQLNNGRMQIVSYQGFWEISGRGERKVPLKYAFPGSFVNLEINTAEPIDSEIVAETLEAPLF